MASRPRKTLRVQTHTHLGQLAYRLERGDLLLFRAAKPNSNPIVPFQQLFVPPYTAEAALFTHVAMFVGGDSIIHATTSGVWKSGTGGVVKEDLWKCTRNQTVCALRAATVSDAHKDQIVQEALALEGTPYDYATVMKAARVGMMRKLGINSAQPGQSHQSYVTESLQYKRLICSRMVQVAYAKVLGTSSPLSVINGRPSTVFTPADIYVNDALTDVL